MPSSHRKFKILNFPPQKVLWKKEGQRKPLKRRSSLPKKIVNPISSTNSTPSLGVGRSRRRSWKGAACSRTRPWPMPRRYFPSSTWLFAISTQREAGSMSMQQCFWSSSPLKSSQGIWEILRTRWRIARSLLSASFARFSGDARHTSWRTWVWAQSWHRRGFRSYQRKSTWRSEERS